MTAKCGRSEHLKILRELPQRSTRVAARNREALGVEVPNPGGGLGLWRGCIESGRACRAHRNRQAQGSDRRRPSPLSTSGCVRSTETFLRGQRIDGGGPPSAQAGSLAVVSMALAEQARRGHGNQGDRSELPANRQIPPCQQLEAEVPMRDPLGESIRGVFRAPRRGSNNRFQSSGSPASATGL